jgi:hypothetical protein
MTAVIFINTMILLANYVNYLSVLVSAGQVNYRQRGTKRSAQRVLVILLVSTGSQTRCLHHDNVEACSKMYQNDLNVR